MTTLGWYPTPSQATQLLRHLLTEAGSMGATELPTGVLALRRGRYRILLNFTETTCSVSWDGARYDVPSRDIVVVMR